jgi:ribonuclease VapC
MIIDTSALVALLDQEAEAERIAHALASTSERVLSAANLVEIGIVMQVRRGDDGARDLDLPLAKLKVDIAAVTAAHADIARKAFRRYGRGRTCCQSQFWRLFCLRPRKGQVSPVAVQRR